MAKVSLVKGGKTVNGKFVAGKSSSGTSATPTTTSSGKISTPSASKSIDYTFNPQKESIQQYNSRIANSRGESAPEVPTIEPMEETGIPSPMQPEALTGAEPVTDARTQALSYLKNQGYAQPDEKEIQGAMANNTSNVVSPPNKFQQGFAAANASGLTAPTTQGQGRAGISQFIPQTPDTTRVDTLIAEDPVFTQMQKAFTDFMSPKKQRESLTQEYSRLVKESGINQLDTELMNMKNVIEGTEDDIRNEVTKAGGFATDSQVLALTNSRNKQLIKNYNNLLETRNNAQQHIDTMIGLSKEDRAMAQSQMMNTFNMGMQILSYRDKMQENARQGYDRIVAQVGYSGLQKMTNNDPYYTGMIEKSLGLGSGGLNQLSLIDAQNRAKQEEREGLELALLRKQLAPTGSSRSTQIVDVGGKKVLVDSQTGESIREITVGENGDGLGNAQAVDNINTLNTLTTHKGIKGTVGAYGLTRWTPLSADAADKQDFIAEVEKLRSNLTLDKLLQAKSQGATFGALSDSERQAIASAATKIGTWAITDDTGKVKGYQTSEKNFKKELDSINNFAKLDYLMKGGSPEEIGVKVMGDGSFWVINSDGSYTQLR